MPEKSKNYLWTDFLTGILIGFVVIIILIFSQLFFFQPQKGLLSKATNISVYTNSGHSLPLPKEYQIPQEDSILVTLNNLNIQFDYLEKANPNFPPYYYKIVKNEKEGLIYIKDNNIRMTIPIEYDALINCQHNLVKVKQDNRFGLVSLEDKIILPIEYHFILEDKPSGYFQLGKDAYWGLMTEKGQVLTPIQYSSISDHFTEGLLQIEKNFKYGYINQNGIEVIPPTYDVVFGDFKNGKVKVALGKQKFYINKNGIRINF